MKEFLVTFPKRNYSGTHVHVLFNLVAPKIDFVVLLSSALRMLFAFDCLCCREANIRYTTIS